MKNDFDELQKQFVELKRMFREQAISETDFKERLKSLQLKDKEGRKWTIGVQTGKWYYFDDEQWIEAVPPSLQDKKAICIYCGCENDLENEACMRCGGPMEDEEEVKTCPECGDKIHPKLDYCLQCEKPDKTWEEGFDLDDEEEKILQVLVRSIQPVSFSKFFGGMGFFFGIVFGVFAGATGYFLKAVALLPSFLQDLHGSLVGGLIFGLAGGVLGFFLLAVLGLVIAMVVNAVLSVFGGIKIKFEHYE
jgi:hypothetical protein